MTDEYLGIQAEVASIIVAEHGPLSTSARACRRCLSQWPCDDYQWAIDVHSRTTPAAHVATTHETTAPVDRRVLTATAHSTLAVGRHAGCPSADVLGPARAGRSDRCPRSDLSFPARSGLSILRWRPRKRRRSPLHHSAGADPGASDYTVAPPEPH